MVIGKPLRTWILRSVWTWNIVSPHVIQAMTYFDSFTHFVFILVYKILLVQSNGDICFCFRF